MKVKEKRREPQETINSRVEMGIYIFFSRIVYLSHLFDMKVRKYSQGRHLSIIFSSVLPVKQVSAGD